MTSSPTNSNNPPAPVQKQRLNVYTVMLLIVLIALCLGCYMLYLELQKYGGFGGWDTGTLRSTGATSWIAPASEFISSNLLS